MNGRENGNGNGHRTDDIAMDSLHPGYRNLSQGLQERVDKKIVERWIIEGEIPEGDPPVALQTSGDRGTTLDNVKATGSLAKDGVVGATHLARETAGKAVSGVESGIIFAADTVASTILTVQLPGERPPRVRVMPGAGGARPRG